MSSGRVRAILGPTASGKSALGLAVAQAWSARGVPTEIVAIDAFTVYRGMDLGTAKPDAMTRMRIPHHLIDVLDPHEELSVVRFRTLAREAIADVHARGATALLVGGSGLYWRAVVDDLSFPPTDPAVREAVAGTAADDPTAAYEQLLESDPEAAAAIGAHNLRRLIRALEVIELTGQKFSTWDDAWKRYDSVYDDLEVLLLDPPNDALRAAIHARARIMVDDGLLDEARRLQGTSRSRTAAAAIGYPEAEAVLNGTLAVERLADTIAERTWRYARRQRSWFRADPRCVTIGPEQLLSRWAEG